MMGSVALLVLCSCGAKKAVVWENRQLPTGIDSQEAVVILLNRYSAHNESLESQSKEEEIEDCLKKVMTAGSPRLKGVSAKDFRKAVFTGIKFENSPRSPQALLLFFRHEEARERVAKLGVRYIVLLNITTYNSDKKSDFAAQGVGWAISESWTRYSNFHAVVLDIKKYSESGEIFSKSEGTVGYVVPFLLFIPLPPIPLLSMTESEACSALGSAIIKFIVNRKELTPP